MLCFSRPVIYLVLLAVVAGAIQTSAATIGNEPYFLPLIASYGVRRQNPRFPNANWGQYQLIRQTSPASGGGEFVLLKLQRVAVIAPFIVGQDAAGYFLLDTRDPNILHLQQFPTKEKWQAALKSAGISQNIQLSNPDILAAQLPDQVIHPEAYSVMHGFFGLSDGIWSAIIQFAGLLVAFVTGLFARSLSSALKFCLGLGIVVDIVAMIIIDGGGPGAFAGLFMFPIIYGLAALLARGLRRLALGIRRLAT